MRFAIDCLVAIMLAGILTGVVLNERYGLTEQAQLDEVRADVARFQQQIALRAALDAGSASSYPRSVDPEWFNEDLPANPLIQGNAPWLEIAGRPHASLEHPPDRVALDSTFARFWYNPHLGIVRARVPGGVSDAKALEWYNHINDCELSSVFADR